MKDLYKNSVALCHVGTVFKMHVQWMYHQSIKNYYTSSLELLINSVSVSGINICGCLHSTYNYYQ